MSIRIKMELKKGVERKAIFERYAKHSFVIGQNLATRVCQILVKVNGKMLVPGPELMLVPGPDCSLNGLTKMVHF